MRLYWFNFAWIRLYWLPLKKTGVKKSTLSFFSRTRISPLPPRQWIPGSFVVRDSGTHYNCYALSVRVGDPNSSNVRSSLTDRCLSADVALQPSHRGTAPNSDCGGLISHYLIQRTATGVRLKGLEKEWPSLSCLILHLTVMPEMLPCPLLDTTQSSSNPSVFLRNFERAPDACAFRPISVGANGAGCNSPPSINSPNPPLSPPHSVEYQQLSEFSSLLADLNTNSGPVPPPHHDVDQHRRKHRRHPPPPPTRIRISTQTNSRIAAATAAFLLS
ncbi:hypothetical protein ACTXT7_003061 [Hymenolepis weldensis]